MSLPAPRALWAIAILAAVGPAAAAPPGKLELGSDHTLGIAAYRSGVPSERGIASEPYPADPADPAFADPLDLRRDIFLLDYDFEEIGVGSQGTGSLDEALARQLPTDTPHRFSFISALYGQYEIALESELSSIALEYGISFDLDLGTPHYGIDPDPWMTLNVAWENPNGALTTPLFFQHFLDSGMVAHESFDRAVLVLGLLAEDGDGDGDAAAQAFHLSFVGGMSQPLLSNESILLSEPGFQVMAWETGPLVPDLAPVMETMGLQLDLAVTPGDRVAAFAGLFLVPEPGRAWLLVLAGLAAVRSALLGAEGRRR